MAKNKLHLKMAAIKAAVAADQKPKKRGFNKFALSGLIAASLLLAFGIASFATNPAMRSDVTTAPIIQTKESALNSALVAPSASPLLAMGSSPLVAAMPAMPNVGTPAPEGSRYGGWLSPDRGDTGLLSPEPEMPDPFKMSMQQQEIDPIDRALEPLVQAGRAEPRVIGPMIARQLRGFIPIATAHQQSRLKNSLNPYAYVNNNPVRYTDPSGLCISGTHPEDTDWKWCKEYCDQYAQGALAWILCMQSCMGGFR